MTRDDLQLTPSALRILKRVCRCDPRAEIEAVAGQLVSACVQEESLAGGLLRSLGLETDSLPAESSDHDEPESIESADVNDGVAVARLIQTFPENVSRIVAEARRIVRHDVRDVGLTSEHLLAATLRFDTSVCRQLQQHGVTSEAVLEAAGEEELAASSIPVSFSLDGLSDDEEPAATESPVSHPSGKHSAVESGDSTSSDRPSSSSTPDYGSTGRVLDACLNRAREGVRVLEDYARFVLDDAALTQSLKDLRHRLARGEQSLQQESLQTHRAHAMVASRDVTGDVGTEVTGELEHHRHQLPDIVQANARRVQESLRSLEEFGKLVSVEFAGQMKQLRYQAYTLHQELLAALGAARSPVAERHARLRTAQLCVLLTEAGCRHPWQDVVEACLEAGADMIQLREKQLSDRELQIRATWLADACRSAGALSIVNDRVDIAQISGADGVHLGQDDCGVAEARRLLGSERLIGLSTHSSADISSATAASADYLGVGPVFRSVTKEFDQLAGLSLVKSAEAHDGPWFAIGGINADNLVEVLAAGAQRVAVSSAVIADDHPRQVVETLRAQLVPHRRNPLC